MKPKTLQQAMKHFSDEQVCIDAVAALRWPNGPVCPKCGHADRRKRMITATGVKDKAAAFGILERGGEVRVFAVPGRRKKALQGHIQEHVQEGTPVYTDAFMSYVGLNKRFQHKIIDHAEKY